jgi:hypothetical protein
MKFLKHKPLAFLFSFCRVRESAGLEGTHGIRQRSLLAAPPGVASVRFMLSLCARQGRE